MSDDRAKQKRSWQFSRFVSVGLIATVVHIVTYVGLVEFGGVSAVWASVPSFCVAVLVSYFGQRHWTFNSLGRHRKQFPKFTAVAILGLLVNVAINVVVVDLAGGSYWVALLIVVAIVPSLTYLANRAWVFRKSW